MRRAHLDFTGDFAQTIGLDWLPRSWRVVGSMPSPSRGVCRLVLVNDILPDGPDAVMTVEISETPFERRIVLKLDGERSPVRFFLASDDSGHRYAVPVERRADFDEWSGDPDAVDPPAWALRVEGGFTFTDPWDR
jgi:hypothetical protein